MAIPSNTPWSESATITRMFLTVCSTVLSLALIFSPEPVSLPPFRPDSPLGRGTKEGRLVSRASPSAPALVGV